MQWLIWASPEAGLCIEVAGQKFRAVRADATPRTAPRMLLNGLRMWGRRDPRTGDSLPLRNHGLSHEGFCCPGEGPA